MAQSAKTKVIENMHKNDDYNPIVHHIGACVCVFLVDSVDLSAS